MQRNQVKVAISLELLRTELADVKAVRHELRAWGNWWMRHEYGRGFAGRSACDKLKDPVTHGNTWRPEADIDPPPAVERTGRCVEQLVPNARRAIRAEYLCRGNWALCGFERKSSYIFWLRCAERALMR